MGLERSDFLLVLLGVTAKVVFLAHAQLNIKFNLLGEGLVAGLVPRIGEKDMDATQRPQWQHVIDHLDGVMPQDTDVFQLVVGNALEQGPDAGFMNLAAQKVVAGSNTCNMGSRLAHAKADFQHGGRLAAKGLRKINGLRGIVQQVLGANGFVGFGLGQGGTPRTQHVALDGAAKGDAIFWRALGSAL